MRLLLAIFLPPLLFLFIGRPIAFLVSLLLCLTVFGWPVSALWAIYALGQYKTDQKIAAAISPPR